MSTNSVLAPLFPRKNMAYKVFHTKSVDIRHTCFTFFDRTSFLIGVELQAFDRMCALCGNDINHDYRVDSLQDIIVCITIHHYRVDSFQDIIVCITIHHYRVDSLQNIIVCVIIHHYRVDSLQDIIVCVISNHYRVDSLQDIIVCIIIHRYRVDSNVVSLKSRYNNMYIPSDFFHANFTWTDAFPRVRPFHLGNNCNFHLFNKDVDPVTPNDAVLDPPDTDHIYSAKV